MCRVGGGESTMIFSYIRRLGPFFGFKILNFNIFLCFQNNDYFRGHDDSVDFYGVHHKFWGSFLLILPLLLNINVQNWNISLEMLTFK